MKEAFLQQSNSSRQLLYEEITNYINLEMERNKKYNSNHLTQGQLVARNHTIHSENVNQSQVYQRQSHAKSYSSINAANKQNSLVSFQPPFQNQYSFLNKYKKFDQLMDMENYFRNLYGRKKQKKYQKELESQMEKQNKERLVLPSIYEKQNQKLAFQQQLLKMKLQFLESRMNKMEPIFTMDYNRLPPINYQRCQCSQPMMMMGYPQQFNPMYPQMNLHNPVSNPQNNSKQPSPADKERRRKLLRKFRIFGIAMYFLTLFPHYSYLFGHFKLKDFLEKYLVAEKKIIRSINQTLIQKFKKIPLYKEIRLIHDEYEEQKTLEGNLTKEKEEEEDPKIKISNQGNNETYIVNLGIFKRIAFMIIKLFDQIVENFQDEIYEFFAIGTLNTSYYSDQTFAVEEMPFIYCHPDKNNLQVTPNQQKALLLSNFLIKKVVYQYLVRLAVDPDWHQELASFSSLKKKQLSFFKLICKQIELSAFFLYELSIKNFYNLIESKQPGNFLKQSESSMPLPVKTMRFPSLFMSHSEKQLFNNGFSMFSNRILSEKSTKSTDKPNNKSKIAKGKNKSNESKQKFDSSQSWSEQEEEIFEQYQLLIQEDPLNLIHNNLQFAQLSKIISQYMKSSYEKAEKSLMKIVEKLRLKVLENRKKNYEQIRQKVIKKKYILTKQHEILQGVIFLRNNEERKLVGFTRKMLEIYMDVLAQNEIDAREKMTDLMSKREHIKLRNSDNLSKKSMNKSVVSMVSSSVPSESQSSSVSSKPKKKK